MVTRKLGPSEPAPLDGFEIKILKVLQQDVSLSVAEIAERVGLSTSPCWRRIDRLDKDGFIRQRVALLDSDKLGLRVQVFVSIKLDTNGWANLDAFAKAVSDIDEIVDCFAVMGVYDYVLRVVTRDIPSYEKFVMGVLSKLPGVAEINSVVAMSTLKSTTSLPL